jgi:hypothetical protein
MRATVRRLWWQFLVLVVLGVAFAVGAQLTPGGSWWKGFIAGIILAAYGALGLWFVVVTTRGAFWQLQAADAETFTAEVFKKWRIRRRGWQVRNGLVVGSHEIDHVAVGPAGVLAIETKWAGGIGRLTITDSAVIGCVGREPVAQALMSADKLRSLLRSTSYGPVSDVTVYPVVALWGPAAPHPTEPVVVRGVTIVRGGDRSHWRALLEPNRLDRNNVQTIRAKVHAFAVDQHSLARMKT